MAVPPAGGDRQARLNAAAWAPGRFVRSYVGSELRPVEAVLLERWADDLRGEVLELGCGAGRLTAHLVERAGHVRAIDLSPAMVERCRRRCPAADVQVGDLADLSGQETGGCTAVVAGWNVLDVLGHEERLRTLGEIRRILVPGGLLVMSSHNRAYIPRLGKPTAVRTQDPLRLAADVLRLPRRLRNHRRMAPLELERAEYAVVNDSAHDYSLLHYYIGAEAQERQLAETGFELLECLDISGRRIDLHEGAPECSELHYAARSARTD